MRPRVVSDPALRSFVNPKAGLAWASGVLGYRQLVVKRHQEMEIGRIGPRGRWRRRTGRLGMGSRTEEGRHVGQG